MLAAGVLAIGLYLLGVPIWAVVGIMALLVAADVAIDIITVIVLARHGCTPLEDDDW